MPSLRPAKQRWSFSQTTHCSRNQKREVRESSSPNAPRPGHSLVTLNAAKTTAVLYDREKTPLKNFKSPFPTIEWAPKSKRLSVTVKKYSTLNAHVKNTVQKATRAARTALYPVINCNSLMPTVNRVFIYQMFFRLILTHAATSAWIVVIGDSNLEKFKAAQNVALYTITGEVPPPCPYSSSIPPIQTEIKRVSAATL